MVVVVVLIYLFACYLSFTFCDCDTVASFDYSTVVTHHMPLHSQLGLFGMMHGDVTGHQCNGDRSRHHASLQ